MLNFDGIERDIFNFDFCPEQKFYCHAFVATAIIGAGAIGAAATVYSANKAASAQQSAAQSAEQTQMNMYNTTRGDLAPYRQLGQTASDQLTNMLPTLTTPITMDETTLRNTPGYQFNLTQGLKSTQNSAAARGLGISGAALKGASAFATGLADNTYQNQFNNANTNQTNAYNRLAGLVNTGESASAQTGILGANAANQTSAAQIGAGNAAAAGINATGGAISNAANNIGGYYAYKGLYGGQTPAQATPSAPSWVTGGAGNQPVLTF